MGNKPEKNQKTEYLQKYYDILDANPTPSDKPTEKPTSRPARTSISDEIAREKKLKNDDAEQDIRLKRMTLDRLFQLLVSETIIIFIFSYLQATHLFGFALEEWSFKILTSVTITQITVMLFVAVSYLFPKKRS